MRLRDAIWALINRSASISLALDGLLQKTRSAAVCLLCHTGCFLIQQYNVTYLPYAYLPILNTKINRKHNGIEELDTHIR